MVSSYHCYHQGVKGLKRKQDQEARKGMQRAYGSDTITEDKNGTEENRRILIIAEYRSTKLIVQ